ncbi:MAG: peptide chain release factor aRF-1, partial [Candidatus Aenigmatarchaeota archaeon]
MEEEKLLKLKKIVKELEKIRGRHTELVSVYVPSGSNLQEVINMLREEYSLAQNVKDKTVRKNVMNALEKIIQHLRIFRKTPENGLVVFCGNISPDPGVSDIKIWSLEPPEKLSVKIYRCDQIFILDPLKEMLREREVYGLIVLDAGEANVGLLKGKSVQELKKLESTVPSKSVKGGMCVSEDTLIQLEDGNIIPIKELSMNEKILSYSFKNFKHYFTNSFEIFKRKANKSYELVLKEPSTSIVLTPEHTVFVVGRNGIVEKKVDELSAGDMLLYVSKLKPKSRDNKSISNELLQLLGYFMGDGTIDNDRVILYDKDLQLLNFYKRLAIKITCKRPTILKRRNSYELRIYKKSFADFLMLNFPNLSKPRENKDIDAVILVLPNQKLRYFLKGLFDAEGYVDKTGIGMRLTNEKIVKKIQLILTRFGIVSSLRGPDKLGRYELRITNSLYIKNFKKEINFSSLKKRKKLLSIVKKYKSGKSTRVPVSGIYIRKLIETCGLKKEDFKRYGMFLLGKRNIGYPPFKRLIKEANKKLKNRQIVNLLKKIYNCGLVTVTVKEKKEIKASKEFYDLYVPGINSFVANGIVVHNSQKRYDRLREDALNEFFKKVGEIASNVFLQQPELKGVIIGGPGPTKETFFQGNYLHHEIQKKVLGVKDTSYTGEYGLRELVNRSEDLLEKASIIKEKEILDKFFSELQKGGNVTYGFKETIKALEIGAVETLLISEGFDWVHAKLKCSKCNITQEKDLPRNKIETQYCEKCNQTMSVENIEELIDLLNEKAKSLGTKIEFISTESSEGAQFKELGGIGAFLRYKLN